MAKTKLTLSNFKKIDSTITLTDLNRINYFVGVNNSGKTSVLNALSTFNDPSTARLFFGPTSEAIIEINDRYLRITYDKDKANHTGNDGSLTLRIVVQHENKEKGANHVIKRKYNYEKFHEASFHFLNRTLREMDLPLIEVRVVMPTNAFEYKTHLTVFEQDNKEINGQYLADGVKSLNDLLYQIYDEQVSDSLQGADALFIIIEEPENSLHPDYQKLIPAILNTFLSDFDDAKRSRIYIFVSTHSPFIVSQASKYPEDQKVYLFDNGHLLNEKLEPTYNSCGYVVNASTVQIVGRMLGGDVTDFGYPENFCLVEESSLQAILDHAKQKGFLKNIQFISTSGLSKIESFSDWLSSFENLNTLIKCNPYYSERYYVIVDDYSEENIKLQKRLDGIKNKLTDRFIKLDCHALEEYYKNFDLDTFNAYNIESKGKNGKDLGIIKAKFASAICKKLNNRYDFMQLFNNKLNFLLR